MSTVARIVDYLASQGIKKSEFYTKTGLSNGYLDKVKELGADKIESIISAYPDIDLFWLITGKTGQKTDENTTLSAGNPHFQALAHKLKGGSVTDSVTNPSQTPLKSGKNTQIRKDYPGTSSTGLVNEPGSPYNLGLPRVVTVNERREENIIYVPVKARAGYLTGYGDPEFISTLPSYRLPGLDNATYRMFEVEGPSMAPNIISGDRVIGQWVQTLSEIRENRVYIIVTKSGVLVKRVLNRVAQRGRIVIKSDTVNHRKEFPSADIDPEDILEIWYCRLKLSADFSEPVEIYHRINDLESEITDIRAENKEMTHSIQEILKQLKPAKK